MLFGSSSDERTLNRLEQEASQYMTTYGGQLAIDFSDSKEESAKTFLDSITSVVQNGPHLILDRIYDGMGFGEIGDEILRKLVVSRVCQPMSKLATVDYLRKKCRKQCCL